MKNDNAVIKLDLDSDREFNEFVNRLWIIKYLGLAIKQAKVYRTVKGYHVYLYTSNSIAPERLILIEALLGDDYRRTLCNLLKIMQNAIDFDVLFQRKYTINKLGQRVQVSEEKYDPERSALVAEILDEELSQRVTDLINLGV